VASRVNTGSVRRVSGAHKFAFWLAVIVAVGVVLRVLYTVLLAPWPPPIGDDAWFYHYEADFLAQGRGFISVSYALLRVTRPSAAHPPLYPLVLAGLAKIGGTGQEAQRLVGTIFGAGTIVTLGVLGRRLAGGRVGLVTAGIAAVYPMLITADGALLSESLYGLLVALCLLATYRLADTRSTGRAICLGVLLGLAALTRGEALLLVPLLVIPMARRPRGGVRVSLITLAAFVVVLAPWSARNWIVFQRPVPVSTDLASAIAGANCRSTYYGGDIGSWANACIKPQPGNEVAAFDRSESDGIRYALDHIGRLPIVAAVRLARTWGLRRNLLPGSKLPRVNDRSPIVLEFGFLMYYVLVLLAVYGFVLLRRRQISVWPLTSTFILVSLTSILVYGDVRFREPAEVSLVALSGVAAHEFWARRGSRSPPAPEVRAGGGSAAPGRL
jgi:4-amino-4-deoxy-L-arabinose transferase-like glycosyltransferase